MHRCNYNGPENVAVNRIAYNSLFNHDKEKVNRAQEIISSMVDQKESYAAVHARIGGKLDPHEGRFEKYYRDPSLYVKLIKPCVIKRSTTDVITYVASDHENFKLRIIRSFKEKNRYSFPSSIIVNHTLSNRSARRRQGVVEETIVEALILGNSNILITTGSGMSFIAALTGNAKLINLNDC